MSAVAFVDLFLVLLDWARIALSLSAYALTFVVLYLTCLRWLLRSADLAELARMFEAGRDELKEQILSAVELGRPGPQDGYDSEQLRALFQKRVASLIKAYRLQVILPTSKIIRWPVTAFVVVLFCIGLMTIPKLRYAQLMARAFLPTANIARVSTLRIEIAEPADPEPVVPRGDPVTIVARLSDESEREVFLESAAPDAQPTIVQMEPAGRQRYAATVLVAGESLAYRVFAAKASTRQYTIQSRRRPHVTKFHKTYHYPPYSRLEDKQVSEDAGDIEALQSSSVDLSIEVDQGVDSAELQIQIGEKKQTIELTPAGPTLLTGRVDVVESGTYRVHLVAKETKFDNKFAPNYEIVAVADLIPDVTLVKPASNVILPGDSIVRLEGAAKDDLGLQNVEQLVRINNGPWIPTTLADGPPKEQVIKKNWDLLDLALKPGDQVATKLAATDLKGNRGESLISQITISSPGFSVNNLENSKQKKHLQESLVALAEASTQLNKDFRALRDIFANSPGNAPALHEAQLKTDVSREQVEALAQTALAALENVTRSAETGIETDDMVLLGRMLSRLRRNELAEAGAYADLIQKSEDRPRDYFDKAVDAAGRVEGTANHVRHAYKNVLAHQQARNALHEVHRLRDNQAEMLEQARQDSQESDEEIKNNAWRRFARRQAAAAKEQQIIEEMLDDLSQYAEYNSARQAGDTRKKLAEQRNRTQETLLKDDAGGKLAEQGGNIQNTLREAEDSLKNLEQSLSSQSGNDRRGLAQSVGLSANELAQLKWKVEDLAGKQKALTEAQSRPNVEPEQVNRQRLETIQASRYAEHRWGSAFGQLSDRADLEDLRRSAVSVFVADTANTAAAVDTLHTTATDADQLDDSAKALSHIEKAYRLLETGHNFLESNSFLSEMAAVEQWNFARADYFDQPLTLWDYWEKRARELPNQLREAGLSEDIKNTMNKALGSAHFKAVDDEAKQRANADYKRSPVAAQMYLLAEAMGDIAEQIEPQMEEARKVIAEYAPSLVAQLRAVSKLAEQVEEHTQDVTGRADGQKPEKTRTDAAGLLGEQQQLNEHIETIRDSLRRDANIQDLSDEEGRQRARDADDATAMLRQPPPKAEDLLAQAAESRQADAQKHALEQAVSQQAKLNEALDLITQHYENLEAGNADQTRLALRQTEQDSDSAQNLDGRYGRLDELAQMLQESPDELKALLEKELIQNQPMQAELAQILDSAVRQAAHGIEEMADRENHIAERLDKIAQNQDRDNPILAPITNRINELAKRAQQLAANAENLADNKVAEAAGKSNNAGAKATEQFDNAKQSLKQGAQKIPKASTPPPSELAEKVEGFAQDVDKAKTELDAAADKTQAAANDQNRDNANQAAQTAREASGEAQSISNEAKQIADQLKEMARQRADADRQVAQTPPPQNQFSQRAKELAQQAANLARDDIPQAAQKAQQAQAEASEQFDSAAGAAANAADRMPTDFSGPPAALAEGVDDFAEAMDQARSDLQSALGKVNETAKAEGERTQAAGQTRDAQTKAADLKRQGNELAKDLRDLAQRNSGQLENADQRQQEINQMAPEVIDDIARAAIHAERLDRSDAQALRQSAQAMEGIAQNELPQAQSALDAATHARQAQPPVEEAYDALVSQLDKFNSLQPDSAQPLQGASRSPESDEIAAWMARTLDSLEAAQLARGNPRPSLAAQQAADRTLQAQQAAMAQARAQSQAQARAQSRSAARNRFASRFSSDRTSADMPPETGQQIPENLRLLSGDWGKLRKLSATDLMNSQKEAVSEDYREMVNAYFRVISQKAKEKN